MAGQLGGAVVELAVGQRLLPPEHRRRLRVDRRPGFEDLVETELGRLVAGVVPLEFDLMTLGRGQERQGVEPRARGADRRPQQGLEVLGQAMDRHGLEEAGGVLEAAGQSCRGAGERERQVELGRAGVDLPGDEGKAGESQLGRRRVLQRQGHLDERRVGEAALDAELVEEALERQLLVGQGAQGGGAHLPQQLGPGERRRRAAAQGQGVDEEADQRLGLRPRPAGHREAGQQVRGIMLRGDAEEQRLEAGHQHHERRRVGSQRHALDRRRQVFRQRQGNHGAAGAADRRVGPVGGERQQVRRRGELAAPPGELLGEYVAGEVPALPGGEVGVLDRQLRQR